MSLVGRPLQLFVPGEEPSCHEVLVIIQCYVDYECDVFTMIAVASHLETCKVCQEELETLRALKAAVRRCNGTGSAAESRL
jgi:hypothetical protein